MSCDKKGSLLLCWVSFAAILFLDENIHNSKCNGRKLNEKHYNKFSRKEEAGGRRSKTLNRASTKSEFCKTQSWWEGTTTTPKCFIKNVVSKTVCKLRRSVKHFSAVSFHSLFHKAELNSFYCKTSLCENVLLRILLALIWGD